MFSGIRSQNYPNPPAHVKKSNLQGLRPVTKERAFHLKSIISIVKHGGDSVMTWDCLAASEQLDN